MADKAIDPTASPQTRTAHSWSPEFWLKIFVVAQLTLLAVEFAPDLSTNGDDAKYYLLGKSIMSGNGFRDLFDPSNPIQTQYPPLFPLVIGIADIFSGSPLIPKIMVGLLCASTLLLLFYYLRRNLALPVLIPLLLAVSLSSALASHATLLMSEVPYLFTTLVALILFELLKKNGGKGAVFWLAAFVAVTPAFIRTIGIAFSAAWIVANVLDKRYKQAIVSALLFIGAMVLLRLTTEWDNPYLDQLFRKNQYDPELGFATASEMFSRIRQNLSLYLFSIIPQTLFGPGLGKMDWIVVAVPLAVPAIVGWIRHFKSPTAIISYYCAFYGVIICMWQTQWSSPRFIIPIVPFILFFMLSGLEFLAGNLQRLLAGIKKKGAAAKPLAPARLTAVVIWIAVLLLCAVNLRGHLNLFIASTITTNDWKNFYSCADWVRLNTPADAVVVSRKPELFYPRSGRRGFVYPFSHDVDKIISSFRENNVRYCVLDNFFWTNTSVRYLFPAIMNHSDKFDVVYSLKNPETYVLEFKAK